MKLRTLNSGCGIKKRKGTDSFFHHLKDELDFLDSIKRYKYFSKMDHKQFNKECHFKKKFGNSQIIDELYFKHYKEIESIKILKNGEFYKMNKNQDVATYNLIIDHEYIDKETNLYIELKEFKTFQPLTDSDLITILDDIENQISSYLNTHNITKYIVHTVSHDSALANDLLLTLTSM